MSFSITLTKDTAILFYDEVKRLTPVRTGTLRDGWNLYTDSNMGTVTNDVEYLPYVNYGTSRQEGKFFIEEALQNTMMKLN